MPGPPSPPVSSASTFSHAILYSLQGFVRAYYGVLSLRACY
jgi:hypothetical protein